MWGEIGNQLNFNHLNFLSKLAGGAVMAVGIWTLAEKSDYISLLQSNTYMATAYILVVAGVVVMITGILGCCATFREQRNLLRVVGLLGINRKHLCDLLLLLFHGHLLCMWCPKVC